MVFRARNPYYLRISQKCVLPLYIFLDERHIDWMSDRVLQHVLADLRPLILPKLRAEADAHLGPGGPPNAKKGTVDVHKGEFYQFCFFFRKTEPHSVLIKTRNFVIAPALAQSKLMPPPPSPPSSSLGNVKGKRTFRTLREDTNDISRKKRKVKAKAKVTVDLDEDEESAVSSVEGNAEDANLEDPARVAPRRSRRSKKLAAGGYAQHNDRTHAADSDAEMTLSHDDSMLDDPHAPSVQLEKDPTEESLGFDVIVHDSETSIKTARIDLEIEDEEQKPKPMLQLSYQGFGIYGHCLCVVVEPFPPIRSSSRASSVALQRETSLRPPNLGLPVRERPREGTPLFLPEYDRGENPASFLEKPLVAVHPTIDEADGADDGNGGMLEFSQVLNAAGDFRTGADNDDEMDGAVFFGDADEGRELL